MNKERKFNRLQEPLRISLTDVISRVGLLKLPILTKVHLQVSANFIQYNNVPQGFAPYISKGSTGKVFIAVPRRAPGVPSTLNYVKLEAGHDDYINPQLHSYPNYEMNELDVSEI